ncbi:zinc-dependent metalloprotease [Sphingobium sp. H39-3-25]|uniref:zinc-dependent metalloprotease n=1 Tax=Sphingobium arseniciresistens TaxID=3030834 RepID=UPI0023B8A74D|nr:zinc-dependent metalloprotease [Sphingobium arseniciresistens]
MKHKNGSRGATARLSLALRGCALSTLAASALALVMAAPAAMAQAPAAAGNAAPAKGVTGQRIEGFIPIIWDAAKGKVYLEIGSFGEDVLYYVSAATGGGSVELPFDRGIMNTAVIHFEKVGKKVLVTDMNTDFRSLSGNAAHAQGVADSFPTSVLAALPIESEAGGKVIVDATSLFMRDAAGIEATLKRANQGSFKFDANRSAFYTKHLKAFPENTEIETISTFSTDAAGALVRNVTPDPTALTMRIHHSFLKAPTGYAAREADPRIGVSAMRFQDYSKPVSEGPETAWITRWRLEKQDPSAAMSPPKKPITFYFDPAIPPAIRHAMKVGLLWWNKSFEAAGFINAIEAKDAPVDMDPEDIRYAYVQWINRDERGFSSGGTYRDPRTGEILGSKTRMDTHRIRTIGNYWDAYMGGLPADGSGITVADPSLLAPNGITGMPNGQRDMVLLRQALLTAHELGHALGFGHNFASSLNDRASVMEYPTPRVKVVNGKLDISESFMKEIGAYDTSMVRYSYTPFAVSGEKSGLDGVIADMRAKGLLYVPDSDPRWTWYDDRATPTESLGEALAARKIMLENYGPNMLLPDEPIGSLRNVRMWMVYLHHRYAIESAVKYIGGLYTNITVKGEAMPATEFIPGTLQKDVLGLLMDAIEPGNLAIPESLLAQLTPDPGKNLEDLSKDDVFDQLRAARILSALVLEPLFDGARAARLVAIGARQSDAVTLPQVVDAVMAHTWKASGDSTVSARALRRVTQEVALESMMILGADDETSPEARAYVLDQIAQLGETLKTRKDSDPLTAGFYRQTARTIATYLEDPKAHAPKTSSSPWGKGPRSRFPQPPGPPLG